MSESGSCKTEKRLSVVIPGYKTPDSIWRRCVESVLCNIGSEDEIICVDDGSPVPSTELDALACSDMRISVVKLHENRGQAFARNKGMELAVGRYVAFVDSDDEVRLGTYSRAIEAIERDRADVVVYGVRVIWTKNGLCKEDVSDERFIGKLDALELRRLYLECVFNYPWNKIYRKSFLQAFKLTFHEHCIPREDEIFNLDCVMANASWTVISHVGQIYYRDDGTSLARYKRFNEECNRTVSETWHRCKKFLENGNVVLGQIGEMTEQALLNSEWVNMWRMGSPFTLGKRVRWFFQHKEIGGVLTLIKTMLRFVVRRFFYFRPIRRRHVKKMFNNVREVKVEDFHR